MSDDPSKTGSGNEPTNAGTGAGTGEGTPAPEPQRDPGEFVVPPLKTDAPSFEKVIPETWRDKPFVKDAAKAADPWDALLKGHEYALQQMGKKEFTIPAPDKATPEEVAQFRKQLGVPDDVSGYELPKVEWASDTEKQLGEALANSRSETFVKGLLAEAHKIGIPKDHLMKLWEAHERLTVSELAGSAEKAAKENAEWADTFNKQFGTSEAKAVKERVWGMFDKHLPEKFKPIFDRVDNETLLAMSVWAENVHKAYGREDTFKQRGTSGSDGGQSLRDERMALMQKREEILRTTGMRDPNYDKINREIEALNNQIGALSRR